MNYFFGYDKNQDIMLKLKDMIVTKVGGINNDNYK